MFDVIYKYIVYNIATEPDNYGLTKCLSVKLNQISNLVKAKDIIL